MAFDQLTQDELRQIVLHEMEHLRRRDDWMNLLQKIGLVLFPLNPAMVWIDRRLATERELACDDGVLSRTHAPRAYATCLTSLAERRLAHRRHRRLTALALGALGAIRRSEFSQRIETILSRRPALSPAMGRVFGAVFAAAVLGAGGALAHAPELVAFGPSASLSAQAAAQPQVPAFAASGAHRVAEDGGVRAARMQSVVFHSKAETAKATPADIRQPARAVIRKPRKASSAPLEPANAVVGSTIQPAMQFEQAALRQMEQQQQRLMLLTNWQDSRPVPVLVTLPDGRTFFATYTATPTQAGWDRLSTLTKRNSSVRSEHARIN